MCFLILIISTIIFAIFYLNNKKLDNTKNKNSNNTKVEEKNDIKEANLTG